MRVTIHQPEFAPWLGFFDKASRADHLIILDNVQFRKNYFQNRNRILTAQGPTWMTVPVRHASTSLIHEVRIAEDAQPAWRERIAGILEAAYRAAPESGAARRSFLALLDGCGESLLDLNLSILRWLMARLEVGTRTSLASAYGVGGDKGERVLALCEAVGASTYVSGVSGREYLDLAAFDRAGIEVEFQEFHHPIYVQLQPGFQPLMSALEPVLLLGERAKEVLRPAWQERIGTVFA